MKLFTSYTFKWWQMGVFKLALLSIGIIIGSIWPELFQDMRTLLIIIAVLTSGYVIMIALKQN